MREISLILLLLLAINGCNEAPDIHPYFIDTDLKEVREHSVLDKPNFVISEQPVKVWPLEHANGFFCIPPEEARAVKEYILKIKDKCNL